MKDEPIALKHLMRVTGWARLPAKLYLERKCKPNEVKLIEDGKVSEAFDLIADREHLENAKAHPPTPLDVLQTATHQADRAYAYDEITEEELVKTKKAAHEKYGSDQEITGPDDTTTAKGKGTPLSAGKPTASPSSDVSEASAGHAKNTSQ